MKEYKSDFRQLSLCFTPEYILHLNLGNVYCFFINSKGGYYSILDGVIYLFQKFYLSPGKHYYYFKKILYSFFKKKFWEKREATFMQSHRVWSVIATTHEGLLVRERRMNCKISEGRQTLEVFKKQEGKEDN